MADYRGEFENWCDQWEKAQEEGIFENMPPVNPQDKQVLGLGSSDTSQDAYWKNFEREVEEQPQVLSEDHAGTPTSKADLAHQSKDIARAANPVYHHTTGMDQELEPWTPNWVDGKELEELAEIKASLYDLECECGKKDAMGESASAVQSKIKSMWEKVNKLSNDLTPNRFKEILD
tara:strand:- start:39571 stop:40098 length:528 start_codon:yes stop_codon:yes gene_type:complete